MYLYILSTEVCSRNNRGISGRSSTTNQELAEPVFVCLMDGLTGEVRVHGQWCLQMTLRSLMRIGGKSKKTCRGVDM